MSYIKDRLWQIAKAKYRGSKHINNWVYIVTYYNHIGGNILTMYCTPEENKPCRVLCKVDNKDKVLTIDEYNKYNFYTVEQLLDSPKLFSYSDSSMDTKITYYFRKDTVFGNKDFSYYVLGGEASE